MNTLSRRGLIGGAVALPAMQARSQGAPLRIGTILSVTGPAAFLGEDMRAGVEIAIEEINAVGGVGGGKVEWMFYDAASQTQKALDSTRRLLSQDRVDIIVGGGSMSGIALAMAPMAEAAGVPFISTEGAMNIVQPVNERRFVFKSTVDDDQVLERFADWCAKNRLTRVAMLADTSGFGQSAVEQMKLVAERAKLAVAYEAFNPTDTDMTAQLTRIKGTDAQVLLCWTVTPAGVVFLKQAQLLGLGDRRLVHGYGFVSQRYMDLAGDAARDLLLLSVKFPVGDQLPEADPLKAATAALTAKFQARYKRPPNQYVAQTYDATMLAREALNRGGRDRAAVRAALEGVRDYQGAGGKFSFSPERHSGLSKSDVVLLDWRQGRFNLADY